MGDSVGARARTGHDALAAWLRARAREADRLASPEEALLAGRFGRYAARRLLAFGLARGAAIVVHVVELAILYEIFAARPFMASLALQNVLLVGDAFFWGALEALRRRLRALGPGAEAAALTTRWLRVALLAGVGAMLLPCGAAAWLFARDGTAPSVLTAYALACALRLALDMPLRAYYSGVFAHRRVHRPVWTTLSGSVALLAVTWLLWAPLGGFAFVVALLVQTLLVRGWLLLYTRRAYRRHRVVPPSLRVALRRPRRPTSPAARSRGPLREALLAGVANLTTRLGGVTLLAAVIPSLSSEGGDDDGAMAFAFALHLAAPSLLVAAQWAFVFYHDYKRVEAEESAALARLLHRRLLVVSAIVGALAWCVAAAMVLVVVPLEDATPPLLALLPATLGLSVWTAVQLRGFARGAFVNQAASALALLVVTLGVLASTGTDEAVGYLALAAGPWSAVIVSAVAERVGRRGSRTEPGLELRSLGAWVRALGGARAPVCVWAADADARVPAVARRIAHALGSRGALVRIRARLLWFESVAGSQGTSRAAWLRAAGGRLARLERVAAGEPVEVSRALEAGGHLRPPRPALAWEALVAAYAADFEGGFAVRLGDPAPEAFVALAPSLRQAIWRDALRVLAGGRPQSPFWVTPYAPDGPLEAFFVAPRPVDPLRAASWWARLSSHGWSSPARRPPGAAPSMEPGDP